MAPQAQAAQTNPSDEVLQTVLVQIGDRLAGGFYAGQIRDSNGPAAA
jgi:hypothetical protein